MGIRVDTPKGPGTIIDQISQTFGSGRFSFTERWAIVKLDRGGRYPFTGKQITRL